MSLLDHDDHSPEAIRARLNEKHSTLFLNEWVYGGIDGVVTTFAIVAGVVGASLSPGIVLILGLANLIGDGFSMAAGCYSSTQADLENYNRLRSREKSHIEHYPEGEKEEVRQIYGAKGFSGNDLETIVDTISKDQDLWIDTMMVGEYGISGPPASPIKAAIHTFWAFVICGSVPLMPFVFGMPMAFESAAIMSGLAFFCIGALKSRWSSKSFWYHGIETAIVGMTAAGMAFAIGYGLKMLGFAA